MVPSPHCRRILRFGEWPSADRELWQNGLEAGDILTGEAYAAGLRSATIRNSARGYGRWLAVLVQVDRLALSLCPVDRVTPARVRAFLAALQCEGNTNNTIKARFWELRSALRILHPDRDFSWLNKPGGQSLSMLLPTVRKAVRIIDSRELARWGEDLMDEALSRGSTNRRTETYRNGLLVAILSNRAPRQLSLASLRLGHSVALHGACYRLTFHAADTKADKRLAYPLRPSLTPRIDHYLEVERPRLLGRHSHDWFWVNRNGDRLAETGIEGVIRRGSKARFGFSFGTHCFRHALATTNMVLNPTHPGVVAAVLGNSPIVVERNYDHGKQIEAARRWQDVWETYLE